MVNNLSKNQALIKMTEIKKIKNYIKTLNSKLISDNKVYKDLIKIKNLVIEAKKIILKYLFSAMEEAQLLQVT